MPTANILLFYFFTGLNVIQLSWTHPQCLDYYPPFRPSQNSAFCNEYSDFGCCTSLRDAEIRQEYREIASSLSHNCQDYAKAIICQECSPYASHIFDAESTQKRTTLPGLCRDYCLEFATQCPHVVQLLTDDPTILSLAEASPQKFCEEIAIGDVDYCYPDILTNTDLDYQLRVADGNSDAACLCVEEFANGLRNPLAAVHAGDGTHRLFVAEQRGKVYVYLRNGTRFVEPFLDIEDTILTSARRGDERGFLGIAFHPNYKNNGRFFVYYSLYQRNTQMIRISEMKVMETDMNKADPNFERVLLEIDEPAPNHNGGQILFGIDGLMYLFVGDGGRGGDPFGEIGNGLNLESLLGSVLRIDVDREENDLPYGIPPDNPFIDVPLAKNETYAYGTRNMWRCSVDRGDPITGEGEGRIFCGDVGQNRFEEIDIILKGGNYGWRGKEGFSCYDPDLCGEDFLVNDVLPIHAYSHSVGKSVTGGYVYRGCQSPNLNGHYIFGDFHNGKLFKLIEDKDTMAWSSLEICMGDDTVCNNGLTGSYPTKILSFGEDESGEVYLLSTDYESNTHYGGKVFKIVDPTRRGNPEECAVDESEVKGDGATTDFTPSEAGKVPCHSRCPTYGIKVNRQVFCSTDYAFKIKVYGRKLYGHERRIKVDVDSVYRLNSSIANFDTSMYLWVQDKATHCKCPRLKVGRSYFIAGKYDFKRKKFIVTETTVSRKWTDKWAIKARSYSPHCPKDITVEVVRDTLRDKNFTNYVLQNFHIELHKIH
ncbi:HHIP-like protein 2 isoform X2 [Glandiceps talaboti]